MASKKKPLARNEMAAKETESEGWRNENATLLAA
jgi:hypothetical protein